MEKKLILKKLKSKGGAEYYQFIAKGKVVESVLTMDTNLIVSLLGEDALDIEVDQVSEVGKITLEV